MVDTLTIKAEETGPTLEEQAAAQDAAAAAADASAPTLEGEGVTRPDNVPEKFWDADKGEVNMEALLASYSALETKQGDTTSEGTADEAVEGAVETAGLDMEALGAEFEEHGELTPESLEALSKVGISKDMVDQYIAGQEAQASAVRDTLLEPVGGEEAYTEMVEWAGDNLPDADIDAFNAALEGGDMNVVKMAVENLKTKFTAANGSEPTRQLGGKPAGSTGTAYESTADLMKDMQNPEYESNPSFRAKVHAKLDRSSIM